MTYVVRFLTVQPMLMGLKLSSQYHSMIQVTQDMVKPNTNQLQGVMAKDHLGQVKEGRHLQDKIQDLQ